jgi:hypothetical protein
MCTILLVRRFWKGFEIVFALSYALARSAYGLT